MLKVYTSDNKYEIHYLDLNGVDVYDYYYPDYVGDAGWVFRYKREDNKFYMFSLPNCYLEDILNILSHLNLNKTCQILEKYLDGGGMFIDDNLLNNPWTIKDREVFIENLNYISKKNWVKEGDIVKDTSEYQDSIGINADIVEIATNLVSYLNNSKDYELELNYI